MGSHTPGHPEYGKTPGVECTTGPLGQGLALAGGMALAERMMYGRYPEITDHHTYVIVCDGCLMEGISHEAASFAEHLGLGRLVVFWDNNAITIDGSVDRSCSDDQLARFAAYGWHPETLVDRLSAQMPRCPATISAPQPATDLGGKTSPRWPICSRRAIPRASR